VVRAVEDAEHRQAVFLIEMVEDVVVVDGEVVAAADTLQQRRPWRVRIIGERDDGFSDVAKRALRYGLELPVRAVGDVEPRRHLCAGIGTVAALLEPSRCVTAGKFPYRCVWARALSKANDEMPCNGCPPSVKVSRL